MEQASESFCEVCGDTGGATRLVLCENIDAGCLGGVHLYCCVPLRSEPPSEAWFCSECQAVRKAAAQARQRARKEQEAARRQRRAERRQEREERKRKRQEDWNEARRQRQRQEEEQRRAAAAAAPAPPARPKGLPNGGAGLAAVPRQSSGVAAVIAAASGRTAPGVPPAAGRPPTAGTSAASARPAVGPGAALASKDTLSFLFSSLSKEDARQKEQEERERQRTAMLQGMLQGDARRMQGSQAEHAKLRHELAARYNLPACQAAGLCWSGTLPLPIPVQGGGSFAASVACLGLPGNPQSQAAADQSLRPLAAATAAAQSLPWQFKSCKDDLGLLPGDAWEQASMLLQVQPDADPQVARQWSALWDHLHDCRQALAVPLPAPAAAGGASGGSSAAEGGTERPFLYLVPNEYEQAHKTLFGLLGLPLPEPEHPRPCSTRQAPGSILRSRRPGEAGEVEHAAAEASEQAATAAAAAAASAAAAGGSASDQPVAAADHAAAADVAAEQVRAAEGDASHREGAVAAGSPAAAAPAGEAAGEESEEEGELTPRGAAAAAGAAAIPAAAAAPAPRPVLTWADIRGDRSAFDRIDRTALELSKGSHYTTPTRQEAGAVRPARTPVFRSFERQAAAEAEARTRPLVALHIALWGFRKDDPAMDVLRQLRALGASTYISVQLVNLLVVHPSLVKNNSLEVPSVARDVPLGLAHLLASTDVKAYLDGSAAILNCLAVRQRLLRGGQCYATEFIPIFPGGITAVLDYPMLASMPPDQLGQVLGALEALAAGSPDPTWVWHVAAAPADLAALQAAADKGQAPPADNWRRWQASSATRALSASETQLPQGGASASPVVQYAANVARQHMYDCRVVFLCTNDPDTQSQAEDRHTILCGGVPELLHLLQQHLQRQPQQKQEWEEQHQQQRQRQQQQQGQQQGQAHAVMLRPPEQPPPLLRKELRRPPSDFVPQP